MSLKYFIFTISFIAVINANGQDNTSSINIGSNCPQVFCYIESEPCQPSTLYRDFKKLISTKFDTLQFLGHENGSFIIKFIVNRIGDVDSIQVIESYGTVSESFKAVLPLLGKWIPGDQSGKKCCIYVALKFELTKEYWSIKRLDPCTLVEDSKLYFRQ